MKSYLLRGICTILLAVVVSQFITTDSANASILTELPDKYVLQTSSDPGAFSPNTDGAYSSYGTWVYIGYVGGWYVWHATKHDATAPKQRQEFANKDSQLSFGEYIFGQVMQGPGARPISSQEDPASNVNSSGGETGESRPARLYNESGVLEQTPAMMGPSWNIMASSSLRHEHTDFLVRRDVDGSGGTRDNYGATLQAGIQRDRWLLDIQLPIERAAYGGVYDHLDYTRLTAAVTTRYALWSDGLNWCDITMGNTFFYSHTWYDNEEKLRQSPADLPDFKEASHGHTRISNFDNPSYLGWASHITARKSFDRLSVGLGVMSERVMNIDGDDELTGEGHYDFIIAGMNASYLITDNFSAHTFVQYSKMFELPDPYDEDTATVGWGASYLLKDKWDINFTMTKDFANKDVNTWGYYLGLGLDF